MVSGADAAAAADFESSSSVASPASSSSPSSSPASSSTSSSSCSSHHNVNTPESVSFDLSAFLLLQSKLLRLERDEDVESSSTSLSLMSERERVANGVSLNKLIISDCHQGLYGRCLVTFAPQHAPLLSATQIGVRDIVSIQPKSSASATAAAQGLFSWSDGVVYRITDKYIVLAIDDYPEIEARAGTFTLTRVANQVVYQRYADAIQRLSSLGSRPANNSRALQVLYNHDVAPSSMSPVPRVVLSPSGASLNEGQQEGLARALASDDVFCLHGPPGTGKSTLLVELIVQCVARGERVLACAPSNIAVDHLVERVVKACAYNNTHAPAGSKTKPSSSTPVFSMFQCIRAGHPARLSPAVLEHSLDAVVKQSDGALVTKDIVTEMTACQAGINKSRDRNERKTLRIEWRRLQGELRFRERKAVKDVLVAAPVIFSTLMGAASHSVQQFSFDTVIIDEAAQALEAACLIPILLCTRRLILAGDHLQLGPVVKSKEAASGGLADTLFDRLARSTHRALLFHALDTQYRMNALVMQWTSTEFYDSRLQAPDDVLSQRLCDLPAVQSTHLTRAPLVLIDTAGCEMSEDEHEAGLSKSNAHEVTLVARYVEQLLAAGVQVAHLVVLSPYLSQIQLLRDTLLPLHPALEIGTIDSMQGREAECVIITLVRSNARGEVGFLSEQRRLNVAITRAKKQACLIGDTDTIGRNPFIRRLVDFCTSSEQCEILSASEFEISLQHSAEPAPSVLVPMHVPKAVSSKVRVAAPAASSADSSPTTLPVPLPQREVFDRERITSICRQVFDASDPKASFAFPSFLAVEERKLVHDVAEQIGGLSHLSTGKGAKRSISICKVTATATAALSLSKVKVSSGASAASGQDKQSLVPKPVVSASSKALARLSAVDRLEALARPAYAAPSQHLSSTPSLFSQLEQDGEDDKVSAESQQQDTSAQRVNDSTAAIPDQSKPTKSNKKTKLLETKVDNDDAFLDSLQLTKGVKTCGSPNCSATVNDYSADACSMCHLRFCYTHSNPILHGCAAAVRQASLARDMHFFAEKKQCRDGLSERQRTELSKKLHEKAMQARQAGEKEKVKKKKGK